MDKFLDSIDNENYGRTIIDPETQEEIVLNDDEVDLIKRIQVMLHAYVCPHDDDCWLRGVVITLALPFLDCS